MKKIFFFPILLLFMHNSKAQNLVLNGDMEQYVTCPTMQGQSNYASNYIALNPSSTAADYLNACATNGSCDVPVNYTGYQQAHSGVAYSGIYLRQSFGSNIKEYVEGTLNSPLAAGICYHFEMYINLGNICKYSSDAVSVYFSDTAVTGNSTFAPLPFLPQINNQPGNYPDSTNWTLVSGNFTANGGENYFIIGCFIPDAQMSQQIVNNTGSDAIYVYVDDILLTPCTAISHVEEGKEFQLYPNPVKDEITVQSTLYNVQSIEIENVVGEQVYNSILNIERSTFNINVSVLVSGIYFVKITTDRGSVVKKFIKE
jgi:hypothetical protein